MPTTPVNPCIGRPLRSFVRRAGRITVAQRRALADHWGRFGLEADTRLDLDAVFGRSARRTLEIGFGMGDALVATARTAPEEDFLGIEVHDPGIGRVLNELDREGLCNVRLLRGDAVVLVERCIAPRALDAVWILFPDPWPKKRHHKRRLIQTGFARMLAARMKPGGHLLLATDCEDYARQMTSVLDGLPDLLEPARPDAAATGHPGTGRAVTKFEARAGRLGYPVWYLAYERL